MLWWDANKEDYEDDDDDAIFTQGATDAHMTNPDAWVTLMEWHADTEEDDAPKNPLFEYCSMKQEEYWAKSPPELGKPTSTRSGPPSPGCSRARGKCTQLYVALDQRGPDTF